MNDEAVKHGEWRNAAEREPVEAAMKADGYVLTSTYGGIGTFGGLEVGVFEKIGVQRNTMPTPMKSLWNGLSQ